MGTLHTGDSLSVFAFIRALREKNISRSLKFTIKVIRGMVSYNWKQCRILTRKYEEIL